MRIAKIEYAKKTCENCEKAPAEVDIHIGTKSLMFSLCKNCAWDLSELLDKTTNTSFTEVTK